MSYIGNQPPDIGAYDVESFDGGGTSFTLKKAATTPSVLLFIDGVRQTPTDAYSVSGVTLTTTATTPSGTDNVTVMFMGDVVDIGAPSADTVSTAKIQDDAVTAAKLANSINTEITANTAKVTNATHTGDVTGATALTIATDAVDIAMLSATGTASSSTFLRGDNAWAAPVSGGITDCSLWVVDTEFQDSANPITSNLVEYSGNNYARIGSAMTESSGVFTFPSTGMWWIYSRGCWYLNNDSDRGDNIILTTTTDFSTGPTWVNTTLAQASLFDSGDWTYSSASSWYLFDVTDVAECKVRFKSSVTNANTYTRHTSVPDGYVETSFMFTRIGDT